MRRPVRIITSSPIVTPLTNIQLDPQGVVEMARWVQENRPECMPEGLFGCEDGSCLYQDGDIVASLFPHNLAEADPFAKHRPSNYAERGTYELSDHRVLSGAELLPELAGRKCYDSFGLKAGRKSNAEYLRHVLTSSPPHASIFYHVHLTFFLGDVSRRVSQEMMRNYVGHGADHEGAPSQESTRYTVHHGAYVAHPWDVENAAKGMTAGLETYARDCEQLYALFMDYVENERLQWYRNNLGPAADPSHTTKLPPMPPHIHKAILGSAAQRHGWGFATSYIWTANPIALVKLFKERDHDAADPEFRRLAHTWKRVCVMRWPNLFPMFIEEILAELEAPHPILDMEPRYFRHDDIGGGLVTFVGHDGDNTILQYADGGKVWMPNAEFAMLTRVS